MASTLSTKIENIVAQSNFEEPAYEAAVEIAELIPSLAARAEQYRAAAKLRREAPLPDDATLLAIPADVVAALDDVLRTMRTVSFNLADLSTYILSKFPEIKEEDNAGVAVQTQLLDMISQVQQSLQGTNKEQPRLVHLGSKQAYFTARFELESKMAPADKEKAPVTNPSIRHAIAELDAAILANIAVAFTDLRKYAVAISLAVARNLKKVREPRRANHGMIS
jgi:hypothetical protein